MDIYANLVELFMHFSGMNDNLDLQPLCSRSWNRVGRTHNQPLLHLIQDRIF